MYCGKCGATDNKTIVSNTEQDGNIVTISHFGICQRCGELLGIKEIFKFEDWDYIDIETIKKELNKIRKVWYNV
jgi:ribosomal protein S27AE